MTKVEIEKVIFDNAKTVKDLQKRVETLEQNHKMDDRQLKELAIVLLSYSENVGDLPESLTKSPLFDSILNLKPCCELCSEFDDDKLCYGFSLRLVMWAHMSNQTMYVWLLEISQYERQWIN